MNKLNSVEKVGDIWLKRNDLFAVANNAKGGKAEGVNWFIQDGIAKGFDTFVTTGSRYSPQCELVSNLCEHYGVKCHLFMSKAKEDTDVIKAIKYNPNSTLHQPFDRGSFQNVMNSKADNYARENNYYFIPFGMQSHKAVDIVARQVGNVPDGVKRIVVPIGSGVTFCGVLKGVKAFKKDVDVLGVITGADPYRVIKKFGPAIWDKVSYKLTTYAPNTRTVRDRYFKKVDAKVGDVQLDPIYEAKCYEYLQPNDLLWIVGYHTI